MYLQAPVQYTVPDRLAYTADLVIRNAEDGKKYLYDVLNIKKKQQRPMASTPNGESQSTSENTGGTRPVASSITSIPENSDTRNRQNRQNRQGNSGNQYQLSENIEADENADIAALSGGENGLLIRVSPVRAWQGQPRKSPQLRRLPAAGFLFCIK